MKRLLTILFACGVLLQLNICLAQQSEKFGGYEVHYNVINTNMLPPQVAQGYDIKRSPSRAMLNITVMDTRDGDGGTPIRANVSSNAINLTGQRRTIEMREIDEAEGAIYYIGELPVANLETYNFTVTVQVPEESEPFELTFRQQFYTE